MDTRQLPQAKQDLEAEIGSMVSEKLRQFKKETGLSVLSLDFIFTDTTTVGDVCQQARLTEVRSDISL